MKKILTFLILAYLSFAINSSNADESVKKTPNKNTLNIGVLLPLSGEFQEIGNSFLKAIQLALYDISNQNINIFPKDSGGNALGAYLSAREFEKQNINIVIGPIFHKNLERLNEINNVTFISLTNKIENIPNNTIAFGININSQIDAIKTYLEKNEISKTLLLSPKNQFIDQAESLKNSKLSFYRTYLYDVSPKKITADVEKITKYRERKKDLERRIKILEKSELQKDKNEIKKLEQRHTLGKVGFDSVLIIDFGERLKSVLTSFMFSDVSNKEVSFLTINQWFDESFFNESALQNLSFPSINYNNLNKFKKKYLKKFKEEPNSVSILAYDALGLIYYCWSNNNFQFKKDQLYNKNGFKGLHGKFLIEGNSSKQSLEIYKVYKKKFIKIN